MDISWSVGCALNQIWLLISISPILYALILFLYDLISVCSMPQMIDIYIIIYPIEGWKNRLYNQIRDIFRYLSNAAFKTRLESERFLPAEYIVQLIFISFSTNDFYA